MKRKGVLLALTALIMAAAAVLAVAAGKGPKTDETKASFTAERTDSKAKECAGEDGTYAAARETFAGTVTGDPRVSGKLVVRTHTLVNQDTGLGTSRGVVRILDADTNKVKAHGKFHAVVTKGSELEGFLAGHVRENGDPPRRDARLWANFSATVAEDGTVTGEFGQGSSDNTAVIQSGRCGGPKHPEPHHGRGHEKAKPKPKRG